MTTLTVRQRCEADGFYLRETCVAEGRAICEEPCDWWNRYMKRLPLVTRAQWVSAALTIVASVVAAAVIGIFSLMWVHNQAFEAVKADVATLKSDVGLIKANLLAGRRVEVRGE